MEDPATVLEAPRRLEGLRVRRGRSYPPPSASSQQWMGGVNNSLAPTPVLSDLSTSTNLMAEVGTEHPRGLARCVSSPNLRKRLQTAP